MVMVTVKGGGSGRLSRVTLGETSDIRVQEKQKLESWLAHCCRYVLKQFLQISWPFSKIFRTCYIWPGGGNPASVTRYGCPLQ